MRKAWKKAVSVLLTLVLIFGVLPAMNVSAENEGGQGSRSIELNFAGTVNGSTVTYDVEGTDVALTVEGAELNDSKVSISEGNLGSVKFKLENFDPDKMQMRVYSNDGFQTYLTVNQNETSLACQLPNVTAVSPTNLTWESTETFNVGLDLSMLNGKLTLTADAYVKNTNDVLLPIPVSGSAGPLSL